MVFERFVTWLSRASDEERVLATKALVAAYLRSGHDGEEGEVAEAVVTALADDPSVEVRQALADAFADEAAAPAHVIASLAADLPQVSAIVLSRSPHFVDGELIDMLANGAPEQQIAIACRPSVSSALAAAIGEVGECEACLGLLSNKGAQIAPGTLHRIAERFGEDAELRRLLLRQSGLSPATHVLLIEQLAHAMAAEVIAGTSLPAGRVNALVRDNCDRALISYAALASEKDLPRVVEAIVASQRMTATFLLRAICIGNISLFANGLAKLAEVSLARVETALADDRQTVFRALYRKAGLPDSAFVVFSDAIGCWRRMLAQATPPDPERMPFLVTRQVLAAYHARPGQKSDSQIDALLVLLRKLAAETSRQNARRVMGRGIAVPDASLALPSPQASAEEAAEQSDVEAEIADAEALKAELSRGSASAVDVTDAEDSEIVPADAVSGEASPSEDQADPNDANGENEPMDVPETVIAEYAFHFAEEIAELEEELAAATLAGAADRIWPPGEAGIDDALYSALSQEDLAAAIDFDGVEAPDAPGAAANDSRVAPMIRAVDSSMPRYTHDEPISVLVGIARSQLKRRAAA